MFFVQRKTIHGLGEYRTSPAVRIWAKSGFYRALKAATQKQGHDWLGGWGFRRKANRTHFPGEGELAKAELEDWGCCMLGFHEVFPLSAGPFKLRFVIWASPRGWPPCCGSWRTVQMHRWSVSVQSQSGEKEVFFPLASQFSPEVISAPSLLCLWISCKYFPVCALPFFICVFFLSCWCFNIFM